MEVHGANGSGKSTLLRLVAGLFPDYRGSVASAASFYLGHKPAVSALLSPRENLEWYESLARAGNGKAESGRSAGVAEALAAVGLEAWSEIPCGRLSQGQQRRAGLARALLCAEPLWLLDEPLTALDSEGRALVGRFIAEHCAGGGAGCCVRPTRRSAARISASSISGGAASMFIAQFRASGCPWCGPGTKS